MIDRENRTGLVAIGVVGLALLFGLPLVVEFYLLLNFTVYVAAAILAVSLALVWGFAGILCFGQAAFFGLGAYVYAVSAFNMTDTTLPFLGAILVPAAFAAALGYFMFYGRLNDVYVGVMTLVVTLIFYKFIGHTAGSEYKIGEAYLGGFNGIPAVPPLTVPGRPDLFLEPQHLWYLGMVCLLIVYFGLRALLASHFGRVIVAIRENEERAELLGYDVRLYKLTVFAIGGGIAGLAGCLFVNWGAFVDPNVFSLKQSALIIIWVLVGGLGTLIGPIVGAVLLEYLTTFLGTQQTIHNSLVMGAILVAFVLLVPRGLIPSIAMLWQKYWVPRRRGRATRRRRPARSAAQAAPASGDD